MENNQTSIATRSAAVAFLIAAAKPEGLAKVVVNELFNQIPVKAEEDQDRLWVVTGADTSAIQQTTTGDELLEAYDEIIASDVDIDPEGILVLDELKYTLFGDLIPPPAAPAEGNAPSTDTVQ